MYTKTPTMAGKNTTRARRPRRAPALRSRVRPAHSVAPHSSHAAPAVGRTRGKIHRGPIGNSRPAARGKTGSIALARAKPVALAAHRKVASVAERVVLVIVLLAAEVVVGLIDLGPAQVVPGASAAEGSDGGKKRVSGVEGNSLDPHPSSLDPRGL